MNQKGFSIFELIVAVAIVGILAAIAIPSFQSYRMKSYNAAAASDVRNLSLFEQSFYSEYSKYVSIVPSDKAANGTVTKNVTLSNGSTVLFEIKVLTPEVEIVVNTDANNQYANIAAHHPGGDHIIALESDYSDLRANGFSGTLTGGDVPAASAAIDLAAWSKYK